MDAKESSREGAADFEHVGAHLVASVGGDDSVHSAHPSRHFTRDCTSPHLYRQHTDDKNRLRIAILTETDYKIMPIRNTHT